MTSQSKTFNCKVFRDGTVVEKQDSIVIEEPLEIRISSGAEKKSVKNISVTMRTPGHDHELATGFLFTEGILRSASDIRNVIQGLDPNGITIELNEGIQPDLKYTDRNFYTTSSCGVCGKSSIDAVRLNCLAVEQHFKIHAEQLIGLPEKVRATQKVFDATGGLHAAALVDSSGSIKFIREDVGRHNATDKVIGATLMQGSLPLSNNLLMLSGRISFELVQKAAMAGIPVVAGVGAPSTLALELAQDLKMTVAGFVREGRFNQYCGEHILFN